MTPDEVTARKNAILTVRTGSHLFGTVVDPQESDLDEQTIFVEDPSDVFAVHPKQQRTTSLSARTAGTGRSTSLDTDAFFYSLHHFIRETAKGNPNTIVMLYAPHTHRITALDPSNALITRREWFLSKQMGENYLGYLKGQVKQYLSPNAKPQRPELIEKYGYDTKGAYHALRVGLQGYELMSQHTLTLPMTTTVNQFLKEVRKGAFTKEEVLAQISYLHGQLDQAIDESDLPAQADYAKLTQLNEDLHRFYWGENVDIIV
jgi:predicted nucleotidyltransferase